MSSSKVRVKRFTRDVAKKEKRFQERKRKRTPVVKFVELKATNDEEDDVQLADVMSDLEEDDVDNDVSHSKLISKISELNGDKKRRNIETRVEASNVVSDIHFSAAKDKIKLEDLLNSVNDPHGDLKKLVKLREQSKVLEAPLNKPERELVQRRAFYQDVSKEVSKWDSVVDAHRNANQVHFPLDETVIQLESTQEVVKTRFAKNNEFEQEIDNLLKSSQNHLTDDKPLTEAEEKFLKSVSLEEAKERHRELQRMRALLSYQETKMKRQKKIKSKRYRKILRKEKLTQQMKDFEQLKEENPQAALDKLVELDKIRALERASLRHKNTGKWAQRSKLRSKYDDSARNALSDQIDLAQQLMKKNNPVSESEDETELPMEDGHEEDGEDKINGDEKEEEVPDFPQDFNPWMKTQKQLLEKIIAEQTTQEDVEDNEEDNTLEKKAAQKPVVQKDLKLSYFTVNDIAETKESDDETGIDAKTEERRKLVAEAFADDNVVDDFEQDKKAIIERERPKRKSSYLPGWGAWGGPSVKESKARKVRFTAEVKAKKRKDASLGNVIISEKVNDSVSKFMVSEVPFPFKNVEQFENSIRHPVGSTWNTESAFRDLTEPAVVTKIGRIIEPMSRDYILKKETSRKPAKSGRKEEST